MMMKRFVILTMMATVIFAASQTEPDLLELIYEQAETLLNNTSNEELRARIPVASKSENKCWRGFFCRAEKSLKAVQLPKLQILQHDIEQYNKEHPVSCSLIRNATDALHTFLKEVMDCAGSFEKSKQLVHMKKHKKA